ncbi:MAG: hypothetical protein OEY89_17400 [Gammaproteobacteria bacterium]|nr:hypothetical protein [Gammaproteobacteria bacterium]
MTHCLHCNQEFEQKKDDHKFCSGKCRAAWHNEKPFKNGVPACIASTRNTKNYITVTMRVAYTDREQLAKLALPNRWFYIVPKQEELKNV